MKPTLVTLSTHLLLLLAMSHADSCADPTATSCPARPVRTVGVVGGGLAGLAAAVEAHRAGAVVLLFEKEPRWVCSHSSSTMFSWVHFLFVLYFFMFFFVCLWLCRLGGNSAKATSGECFSLALISSLLILHFPT